MIGAIQTAGWFGLMGFAAIAGVALGIGIAYAASWLAVREVMRGRR